MHLLVSGAGLITLGGSLVAVKLQAWEVRLSEKLAAARNSHNAAMQRQPRVSKSLPSPSPLPPPTKGIMHQVQRIQHQIQKMNAETVAYVGGSDAAPPSDKYATDGADTPAVSASAPAVGGDEQSAPASEVSTKWTEAILSTEELAARQNALDEVMKLDTLSGAIASIGESTEQPGGSHEESTHRSAEELRLAALIEVHATRYFSCGCSCRVRSRVCSRRRHFR